MKYTIILNAISKGLIIQFIYNGFEIKLLPQKFEKNKKDKLCACGIRQNKNNHELNLDAIEHFDLKYIRRLRIFS